MKMHIRMSSLLLSLVTAAAIMSCDERQSARDNTNAQNSALTEQKMEDLAPAEGVFAGNVHLSGVNTDIFCVITVKRWIENVRTSQSDQPADTVELPKLTATITFPVLDTIEDSEVPHYAIVTNPLGGMRRVMVDYGNYNPKNNHMTLPYMVPNYNQGSFGEFRGDLKDGHFRGEWDAKSIGMVGTFDLVKTTSDISDDAGGGL